MRAALDEARRVGGAGDVPVGAVLLDPAGAVVATAGNEREASGDPTAHAEVLALRRAAALSGRWRLDGHTLVVTLEPCTMCAAAISFARIRRLYYGAEDEKGGGVDNGVRFYRQPTCHHAPEVYSGISGQEAGDILIDFFRQKREDT